MEGQGPGQLGLSMLALQPMRGSGGRAYGAPWRTGEPMVPEAFRVAVAFPGRGMTVEDGQRGAG